MRGITLSCLINLGLVFLSGKEGNLSQCVAVLYVIVNLKHVLFWRNVGTLPLHVPNKRKGERRFLFLFISVIFYVNWGGVFFYFSILIPSIRREIERTSTLTLLLDFDTLSKDWKS